MNKYVVFDLDRTVVDSFEPETVSLKEAIENIMGKKISTEYLAKFASQPTSITFKELELTEEQIVLLKKEWQRIFDSIEMKCFPGMKELIIDLHNRVSGIGVVTSRNEEEFFELDGVLGEAINCFSIVVTSDKTSKPKPDKEGMGLILKHFNCTPDDVIYVGDSTGDKLFAQNSNVNFIPVCLDNKELSSEDGACFTVAQIKDKLEAFINEKIK